MKLAAVFIACAVNATISSRVTWYVPLCFVCFFVTPSISSLNSGDALDGGGSTCFRIFVGWTFGTL